MILMIDNYDSFTWNLVQYLGELGEEVQVRRNDEIDCDGISRLKPEALVLSPGPCTPKEAGVCVAAVQRFAGSLPILGVCLGHQSIGAAYGGKVARAQKVMHGKTSAIHHKGEGVFAGLPSPFVATRYHSLVVTQVPEELEVTAWTEDEAGKMAEVMGLRHPDLPVEGVQFHPESILTQEGHALLQNFLLQAAPA